MIRQNDKAPFSQRQLRVGELIKQSLGQIFLRDEAKVPTLVTKNIEKSGNYVGIMPTQEYKDWTKSSIFIKKRG